MNRVADQTDRPTQDIDLLLGQYFQNEMPRPWPAFQAPRRQTVPFRPKARRPAHALSSRWALAATVALLTAAGWLLSGSATHVGQGGDRPGFTPGIDAHRDKSGHHLHQQDGRPDQKLPDDTLPIPDDGD
jgi:hypothetical protein